MSKNVHPISKESQPAPASRSLSPFAEMEQMFEQMLSSNWMRPFNWESPSHGRLAQPFGGKMPRVDVIDRDDEIMVRAELPGVDKKDLDISLANNTVTIKGSSKQEQKEEKGDYYRCEISQGSFSRTLALPADVDTDKAKANFRDGLLELTLPKLKSAQKRSIKVE
jgi:HSP20 family protein